MQNRNNDPRLNFFFSKCKAYKLKITPQRIAIFFELIESKNHPSADSMYQSIRKAFPNISFDTVNRTLLTFANVGIIDVVEGQGGPRRFDSDLEIHHHFHCRICGEIIDFHNKNYDQLEIPAHIEKKYTVLNKRVVLDGICNKCSLKNDTICMGNSRSHKST
jgi:Fur family peroxide stress response transcriptional regulator